MRVLLGATLLAGLYSATVFGSASGTISFTGDKVLQGTDTYTLEISRASGSGDVSVDYIVSGVEVDNPRGTISWTGTNTAPDVDITITLESAGYGTITLFNPQGYGDDVAPTIDAGSASMNLTHLPILVTGDSWSHWVGPNPHPQFYDDYLDSEFEVVANAATQQRGLTYNLFGNLHSLEEQINAELEANPLAKIVVIASAGDNDMFAALYDANFDPADPDAVDLWMDAVRRISDQIVAKGALPVWGNHPLVPFFSNNPSWDADFTALVHEINQELLTYCQENGFGYVDLHDTFIEFDGTNYDFKEDPVLGPYNLQVDLDAEPPIEYEDQAHAYTEHAAELYADKVQEAIDAVVPNAQQSLSLTGTAFSAEEGTSFSIDAVRSESLSGAGLAYLLLSPGSLSSPGMWTVNWVDGEGGLKSKSITLDSVSADTSAHISLPAWSGAPIGIETATLEIYNTDGAGEISLASDLILGREEEYFDIVVERTDGQQGTAEVTYTIDSTDFLVDSSDASGTFTWDADERGVKTQRVYVKRLTGSIQTDEFATVSLSGQSGSVGTPTLGLSTADLQIINTKVPGKISFCDTAKKDKCKTDVTSFEMNEGETFKIDIRRLGVLDGTAATTVAVSPPGLISGFPQPVSWINADPYNDAANGGYIASYPRSQTISVPLPEVDEDTTIWIVFSAPSGSEGTPTTGMWGVNVLIKNVP